MKIYGIQKTTLLDYPGHVAATLFLNGCNFFCPFCHNSDLALGSAEEAFTMAELDEFLKKRVGILEGICITGGEPTLHPDLPELISQIRSYGYLVKLDTNGYRPDVLKALCGKGLLDYVAMDIKSSRERYPIVAGVPQLSVNVVEESVAFLQADTVPYEFRTTVVKELHRAEDFRQIGPWIQGCRQYFLQNYVDNESVMVPGFTSCTREELMEFASIVSPFVGQVSIRGVEI